MRENLSYNQQESQNREHDLNRLRPALFGSDRLHSPLRRGSCSQGSYSPHDINIQNGPTNRDNHHRNADFVSMNGKYKSGNEEAAANEPNPISKRRPLTAITAVQALCNKIKMKLVRPMSQEPCLCPFSAGTHVCSVTILVILFRKFICPFVDAPRRSEVTTKITRSVMRSSGLCLHIRASCFSAIACSNALAPLSGRHFCKQPVYRPSGSSFIGQSGAISRDPGAYLTRMIHGREPCRSMRVTNLLTISGLSSKYSDHQINDDYCAEKHIQVRSAN